MFTSKFSLFWAGGPKTPSNRRAGSEIGNDVHVNYGAGYRSQLNSSQESSVLAIFAA